MPKRPRPKHFSTFINCLLLCFCWVMPIRAQTTTAVSKPVTVDDYNKLVIQYRFSKPDSGIYFASKGLDLARNLHDLKGQGQMLNHWGIIDENQGRFEMGRQKYLEAIKVYQQAGFKEGIGNETIRLGVTEMRKAHFDKAIGFFLEAMKIHEAINNQPGIMECYDVLGEGYMGLSNYDVALGYLIKGELLSRKLPFSGITLYMYNNLGVCYTKTDDLPKAFMWLQKGVDKSNEQQYAGLHVTLLNSLAMAFTKNGERDKAIQIQLSALKQAHEIQNYLRELQTLNGLADNYAVTDPNKALGYLKQALTLAEQKGAGKLILETASRMSAIYEKRGDYKQALALVKREHALTDSIFNLAKTTEIAGLQANYELHNSQSKVERLQISNQVQKKQQDIIITVTAGISLVLIVLLYYYTRVRSFNRRLSVLNEELKTSNDVKDKIFSVVGHDLRAPLATVRNFLHMLDDDSLSEEEKAGIIESLSENTDASLTVLNQLLRWGQMQIKGVLINPSVFDANQVIDSNLALFKTAAHEKNITIKRKTQQPLMVNADADHFDFVMRNLLSNAIKFSHQGDTVTVGNGPLQANGFMSFYVEDTGVGMSAEQVRHIFDRNNVSTEGTLGEKGTSLGLLMCREYVEANGGSITVESEEGKGTTFRFTMRGAEQSA